MRRTIPILATSVLVLMLAAAPAAAVPKDYPSFDTWCDMDGDGVLETRTLQVASGVPGWTVWPVAVHAPAIWFGGHVDVYDDGNLVDSADYPVRPGMVSKVTYCTQELTFTRDDGVVRHVVWDPLWLFFPPPAIPPIDA